MRAVAGIVLALAITLGGIFVGEYVGLLNFQFFGSRYEDAKNQIFHNSQAYNDAMLRDLQELKRDYESADPEHRALLKEMILHRYEIYDVSRLPPELRTFYAQLERAY